MAQLAAVVDELVEAERELAAGAARRAVLVERARRLSVADAAANRAEADTAGVHPRPKGWSVEVVAWRELVSELACALRIPERTAETLIATSRALVCELPATLSALTGGEISYRHVEKLIDHVQSLPEGAYPAFEEAVLPDARELTVPAFDRKARRVRERLHPESIRARAAASRELRSVFWDPARDGMAYLTAYLPADVAVAAYNRVDEVATSLRNEYETRTQAQLRADVFGDLLIDGVTTPDTLTPSTVPDDDIAAIFAQELADLNATGIDAVFDDVDTVEGDERDADGAISAYQASTRSTAASGCGSTGYEQRVIASLHGIGAGITAKVMVTVPVLTLLGRDDTQQATLEGYGPIDPDTATRPAATAPSFTRILTHPETGTILSIGRKAHPVPTDMRRWLQLRDQTCRKPGCTRPAHQCDINHTCAYEHGGETCHDNLAHLCKKHHNEKHHTTWRYQHADDRGTLTWTSPAGREYTARPAQDLQPPQPPRTSPPRFI